MAAGGGRAPGAPGGPSGHLYRAGDADAARDVHDRTARLADNVRSVRLDRDLATMNRVAASCRQ
ncbi:hypothetical protein [Pilimelia anulata]|uniref:hypothetical protein n=1 Tax=Pilimelia anulata TaxID=53371 RepID=UPI00166AF744|nr:hypothetical protein [Pilimelia anulata]